MENNKLLAEYLGLRIKIVKTKFKTKNSLMVLNVNDDEVFEWEPDSDWNQLMMVVDKIEKNCAGFIPWLCIHRVLDDKWKYRASILSDIFSYGNSPIEAVYNACVEYIESKNDEKAV